MSSAFARQENSKRDGVQHRQQRQNNYLEPQPRETEAGRKPKTADIGTAEAEGRKPVVTEDEEKGIADRTEKLE